MLPAASKQAGGHFWGGEKVLGPPPGGPNFYLLKYKTVVRTYTHYGTYIIIIYQLMTYHGILKQNVRF